MARMLVAVVVLVFLMCSGRPAFAGLLEYVGRADDSYTYTIQSRAEFGPITAHTIRMTSQTWKGMVWTHWLTVFVPSELRHPEKAMLLIDGGTTQADGPDLSSSEALVMAAIAEDAGTLVAMLEQVPNQPLFDGKEEDAIIAYTFDQFLETGDEDWPLLLPMVKSAVRAMDTVEDFARTTLHERVEEFFLLGGSKRGWTTWLAAVADKRVFAIAPVVIDLLNMEPQMAHQLRCYGAYSEQIAEYTSRSIQDRMSTDAGARLLRIVDPYAYRDALGLPKLIVLGTNDPYWTVDAANLYVPGLKGVKHLHYQANTGHDVTPRGVATIAVFYRSLVDGRPLPEYRWEKGSDGALEVVWADPEAQAVLWKAFSASRDFRDAEWHSEELDGEGRCVAAVDPPEQGWVAYYVELIGSRDGAEYGLCTAMTVLPEALPFPEAAD